MDNLPTHRFLWKVAEDFTPEKLDEFVKKDKRGYLLEVDVEYPKGLLENHNELPFLAEGMKIGREEKLVPNQGTESSTKAWFKIKKGEPGY